MKEKLTKLIDVKSIVTIVLTLNFVALSIMGDITAQDVMNIFLIVISFYFGVQTAKKESETRN